MLLLLLLAAFVVANKIGVAVVVRLTSTKVRDHDMPNSKALLDLP